MSKYFDEAYKFIEESVDNGEKVLVHCFAGVSRAPSILISYLIRKHRMSVDNALRMVQEKRNKVRPNSGFMRQLKELDNLVQVDNSIKEPEKK